MKVNMKLLFEAHLNDGCRKRIFYTKVDKAV